MNFRALIILGVILLVALASFFPIKAFADRRARESALAQAKASEQAGDVDLALRHMERYTAAWPKDLPGLAYQAKLLAQNPQSIPQLLNAAQVNDRLLRLEPDGPESQEVRRRLVKLYIQYSDYLRQNSEAQKERGSEASNLRYRAASTIAQQMIDRGAQDAEAYRLLAMGLEGMVVPGDAKGIKVATEAFQKAIELDPADTTAPERLAFVQSVQKKDPVAAEATMDALLKANPKSVAARLARYRFFTRQRENAKALAEIDAASALAPNDTEVQAFAANDAIQRLDYVSAKQHIDAIPATGPNELLIRTLRGSLDLSESHPDEAVEEWRKGLLSVGGGSVDLTWRLAYTLIEQGRVEDAAPLVNRFQNLAGEAQEPKARFLHALLDQRRGRSRAAIRELNRVADRIPPIYQPDLYLTLGRCHESLGETAQALTAYEKARSLVPSSPVPRRAIAGIMNAKNPTVAAEQMERALSQSPDDIALLVDVGRMRFARQAVLPEGQRVWDGVLELVNHAVQLDPKNAAVQTLQADTLAASGQLAQAADLLHRSLEGPSKKKLEIWLTYAGALDRLGRRDEALQALETASKPENAGDHASLRTARAKVLARLDRAQAARDALTIDRDKIPKAERPELDHALAELCRELNDRVGARNAMADWAKQLPDKPEPGLALLALAQSYNDDVAAQLGLEALRNVGGDVQPYGLAARALELLRADRPKATGAEPSAPVTPAEAKRLEEAEKLVNQLMVDAPQLSVGPMIQGMILERRGRIDEAINAYQLSIKDGSMSPGLPRLIELLARQDKFEEIDKLKAKFEGRASVTGTPSLVTSFSQIEAAVDLQRGDNLRAEKAVADMVAKQPDNLTVRVSHARLLSSLGKNREAEATLRDLTARKPTDPAPFVALVAFRAQHPDLGDPGKLLDEIRTGYKGPHPELLQARCQWLSGDVPGAAKKYDAAVASNGDDLTTLRDAWEYDEANRRFPEAEAVLRRALKVDPKATWAARALAVRLTAQPEQANWQEAWALIKPGAPGAGNAPEDRLIRATVLARSPDPSQRAEAVPAMLALANDLPASNAVAIQARTRLAQAFLEVNRAGDAAQIIAPVADDTDRPNAQALAISIEALSRAQDLAPARKQLDRLVALDPQSPGTAASKAWVLSRSGKANEAFDVIAAAYSEAEDKPNGELLALAFQDLLTKMGDKDGALKLAQRIATKWPRYSYILAKADLPAGNTGDAIRACQAALEAGETAQSLSVATEIAVAKRNDPATLKAIVEMASSVAAQGQKNPELLNFIATLRHLQGHYDEEVALYRSVLESAPTSYQFLNNMAWTLCEGLHQYDEALERANEVIRRVGLSNDGQSAQFFDTRGVIHERLGKSKEAIADLERSIKYSPNATTYFHLARTYREAKQLDEYRRCRDQAKQMRLEASSLDPTDQADFSSIMNGN